MLEDDNVAPKDNKSKDEPSSGTPKWITNLGALATIFVALAGVCFTALQLKETAKANSTTAQANRDSESDKLQLGKAQIIDNQNARADQAKLHSEDLLIELRKHKLDLDQQTSAAQATIVKNENERLSATVTHLFSPNSSSEGDLASLFEYVDGDVHGRTVVENAALARLAEPNSRAEIEIAFRLLERLGQASLPSVIEANRIARRSYDDSICALINLNNGGQVANIKVENTRLLSTLIKSSIEAGEDFMYVIATFNQRTNNGPTCFTTNKADQLERKRELASFSLHRSNDSIFLLIADQQKLTKLTEMTIDLRNTYLEHRFIEDSSPVNKYKRVEAKNAYVEHDSELDPSRKGSIIKAPVWAAKDVEYIPFTSDYSQTIFERDGKPAAWR